MPFALDTDLRNELLDRFFGGQSMTALPADWEMSLWTADPFDGGTEVTGTNYARQVFPAASWETLGGMRQNKEVMRWPATGTAGGTWTTPLRYIGLSVVGAAPRIALLGYQGADTTLTTGQYAEIPYAALRLGPMRAINGPDTIWISTPFARSIFEFIIGGGAGSPFSVPTDWELALFAENPITGSGVEIYDPEYARLTRPNDLTEWSAATSGKTNLTPIRWPDSGTPARVWGRITHLGLCPPGQSPSIAIPIEPRTVGPGTPLAFAPGDINISWYF